MIITVAAGCKLVPFEFWDSGLESHSENRCISAFLSVFIFSCVGTGFATNPFPVQGVLPDDYKQYCKNERQSVGLHKKKKSVGKSSLILFLNILYSFSDC